MEAVFVVYKTDSHHSYASRDIIGVATDKLNAMKICSKQAKKENNKIDADQIWNLDRLKQTQGYSGEGEFQYEELKTNCLL